MRNGGNLEALDRSGGAEVVLVEYGAEIGRPQAFHAVPEALREQITRQAVVGVNPHEGLALYCRTCDLLLNGAGTGGSCPICGEHDRSRVLYFLAELEAEHGEGGGA